MPTWAYMPSVTSDNRVGTVLRGKYRLERLLGVGGMAAVYAAVHRNGYRVAVKILHPWAAADEAIVKRFVREGYIANAIEHPSAVHVLDDDVAEDGAVFLVMELLRGRALADLAVPGTSLALDAVLDATEQLLDVLAAAHAKQIVHRDLKPDNLFVTESGQIKLLDLGIARMRNLAGSIHATRTGSVMGTPGYMAPEQVLGLQDRIDARTDLWAVGATMHYLLSGRIVHQTDSIETTMMRAATMPVDPLTSIAPHVPGPIAAFVDRALAMEPGQRWQDAPSMRRALSQARKLARVEAFVPTAPLARLVSAAGPESEPAVSHAEGATTIAATANTMRSLDRSSRRSWGVWGALALSAALAAAVFGLRVQAPKLVDEPVPAAHAPTEATDTLPAPVVPGLLAPEPPVAVPAAAVSALPSAPRRRTPARVAATARSSTAAAPAPKPADPFDAP
jgi:serine/threonine-protein kinase